MIKFCESFSLGSLLNESQTYQGNPCDVYPDLSSFTGSGIIQNSITCIKRSAPSKDHFIWYQSFVSWYRFYPIQLFFFVICPGSCFVLVLLFAFLFASCCVLVLVLVSCFFQTLSKKKYVWTLLQILFGDNLAYWKNFGVEWALESMCLFAYWTNCLNYQREIWKESIIKKVAEILKKKEE